MRIMIKSASVLAIVSMLSGCIIAHDRGHHKGWQHDNGHHKGWHHHHRGW
ncbi:hypothetical protein LQ939_13845 [Pantoea alhagi]|nr:hypothetical protein [Pantoea alhagi]URQ59838.1 hypothetical protein LQ939_13845 [Pantoea alhagi]